MCPSFEGVALHVDRVKPPLATNPLSLDLAIACVRSRLHVLLAGYYDQSALPCTGSIRDVKEFRHTSLLLSSSSLLPTCC